MKHETLPMKSSIIKLIIDEQKVVAYKIHFSFLCFENEFVSCRYLSNMIIFTSYNLLSHFF